MERMTAAFETLAADSGNATARDDLDAARTELSLLLSDSVI